MPQATVDEPSGAKRMVKSLMVHQTCGRQDAGKFSSGERSDPTETVGENARFFYAFSARPALKIVFLTVKGKNRQTSTRGLPIFFCPLLSPCCVLYWLQESDEL